MKHPILVTVIAVCIVGFIAISLSGTYTERSKKLDTNNVLHTPDTQGEDKTTPTPIVGSDSDAHGCKASAGYSWCEVKNRCLRVWEESCASDGGAVPSLIDKRWTWIRTVYADGRIVESKRPGTFGLMFGSDGHVSVDTDCNTMGGTYMTSGASLTFSNIMSTLMYCEGSQESEFSAMLGNVSAFSLMSDGRLLLQFRGNEGEMILK